MPRFIIGLLVAFLTLGVGIAASMFWNDSRESPLSAAYPNQPPTANARVSETATETSTVTASGSDTAPVEDGHGPYPDALKGGILNGRAQSLPQPAYPPTAKAARASGAVAVEVVVGETGGVISAKAVSGHALLQRSAVAAARQARFAPTLLSGKPVKVSGTITYNFPAQ